MDIFSSNFIYLTLRNYCRYKDQNENDENISKKQQSNKVLVEHCIIVEQLSCKKQIDR